MWPDYIKIQFHPSTTAQISFTSTSQPVQQILELNTSNLTEPRQKYHNMSPENKPKTKDSKGDGSTEKMPSNTNNFTSDFKYENQAAVFNIQMTTAGNVTFGDYAIQVMKEVFKAGAVMKKKE